ncbi:hypothetical protein [Cellulomonas endophytica]|uniref:hypothetical protein n=1 Tax=Cellulomonas endophytica TaxID=2494735 RepID=UPI0010136D60|nr:hypothetical protein [Cellulomonas endophytica]
MDELLTVAAVVTAVAAGPPAAALAALGVRRRGGPRGLLPGAAGRHRREQALLRARTERALDALRRDGRRAGPRELLLLRRLRKDVRAYVRQVPLDEQDLARLTARLELLADGLPVHVRARRAPHRVPGGAEVREAWTTLLDACGDEAAALHVERSRGAVAGLLGAAEALALEPRRRPGGASSHASA